LNSRTCGIWLRIRSFASSAMLCVVIGGAIKCEAAELEVHEVVVHEGRGGVAGGGGLVYIYTYKCRLKG
jgi:hypothetical protein